MNKYKASIASEYNFLFSFEHGFMGKSQVLIYKTEKPMWTRGRRKHVTHILKTNTFSWLLSKEKKNDHLSKDEFQPQNTGSSYVRIEMLKMRAVFICRKISQLALPLRLSSYTSHEI